MEVGSQMEITSPRPMSKVLLALNGRLMEEVVEERIVMEDGELLLTILVLLSSHLPMMISLMKFNGVNRFHFHLAQASLHLEILWLW